MKKMCFILLTFGYSILSCDNEIGEDIKPESKTEKYFTLVGEWKGFETYGGYGGDSYFTPENTDNILSLTFIRNGQLIIIENYDPTFVTDCFATKVNDEPNDYLTINSDIIYSMFGTLMLPSRHFIVSLTDTLNIYEANWSDGYGHRFKRTTK
ncbi:MAG: hypothetical protein A2041_09760 [Bacteroidetes bacterium GWA2_31_9b]|nr:MAG: hypothetical protein A2041_09760 [Bacteroidetes bacterium GWA2_31_9b]